MNLKMNNRIPLTLQKARYLAYQYGIRPAEFDQLTPAELNLYLRARTEYEQERWDTLTYILTGQKPSTKVGIHNLERLDSYLS